MGDETGTGTGTANPTGRTRQYKAHTAAQEPHNLAAGEWYLIEVLNPSGYSFVTPYLVGRPTRSLRDAKENARDYAVSTEHEVRVLRATFKQVSRTGRRRVGKAWDAMTDGGILTVKAGPQPPEPEHEAETVSRFLTGR